MRRARSIRQLAAGAIVAATVLAACGGDDNGGDSGGGSPGTTAAPATTAAGADTTEGGSDDGAEVITATVGVVGPKSGVAPHFFTDMLRGFELAIPEVRERYGVEIVLIEADDEGSPDVASRVIQRLLNEDDVDAILGPSQSGPALQVAEIIQRAGRPWLISIAAADQILTEDLDPNWGFRFQNTNQQTIDVTADLLFAEGNTVGVFYSTEGYGQSNLESIKATAEARGVTIAAEEGFEPGTPDLTSAARRMRDAGVNAVFYAISNGSDIAALVRAMEQVGFEPETQVATQTILNEFVDLATPAQWEDIIIPDPRDLNGAPFLGVMEQYVEQYGEAPLLSAAVFPSYSAALGYGQAVAAAGDPRDFEAVRDALQGIDELDVNGMLFAQPFSATDRTLFTNSASDWYLHVLDENGELLSIGQPG